MKVNLDNAMPRYLQVKEYFKGRIADGTWKNGDRLPSMRDLASECGVTPVTVASAIAQLEKEQLLVRLHGKGTFVTKPSPRFTENEMVGIVMNTTGHLYGTLSSRIIKNLEEHEHYCIVVGSPSFSRKSNNSKIKSLIERNPGTLVIDGLASFPFEMLENYTGRLIFINRFEHNGQIPADYVLTDSYRGGNIVAGHLLSLGFDRIFFDTISYSLYKNSIYQINMVKGAVDAMEKNGLPSENFIVCTEKNKEGWRGVITQEKKPLAVFCNGDFRAKVFYELARELGLRIPDDLTLVGYFNTPWCEVFHPNLTSVSIREEEMAGILVENILEDEAERKTVMLEPELIARGSTVV